MRSGSPPGGDYLEVMPTLPAGCVDMVLADPPYGTTACPWDSVIPLDRMWDDVHILAKSNAAFVFTACQPFTTRLGANNKGRRSGTWTASRRWPTPRAPWRSWSLRHGQNGMERRLGSHLFNLLFLFTRDPSKGF